MLEACYMGQVFCGIVFKKMFSITSHAIDSGKAKFRTRCCTNRAVFYQSNIEELLGPKKDYHFTFTSIPSLEIHF